MKDGALIFILWQSVSKAKRRRISAVPGKGRRGRDSARYARAIPGGGWRSERSEGASAPCRSVSEILKKSKQRRHRPERSAGRHVPWGTGAEHRGGERMARRRVNPALDAKKAEAVISLGFSAERAGFEPANPFGRSRAFQTRLFSHSSTSPCGLRVQI